MSEAVERLIREGRQAESEGRLREAYQLYREAAAQAPGNAKAHVNLGAVLEALQDPDAALAAYAAAAEADPADPYAAYNLGRLRLLRGELPAAEGLLARALEAKPDFPEARLALANLYRAQGRLARAASALEHLLRGQGADGGPWLLYGMVLGGLRRWGEAESALRRALTADASEPDAWYWLGNALAGQERPGQAAEHYRRALSLRPDHAHAWCNLGHVLADTGVMDEARRAFDKALALRPQLGDALVGLGNLHMARRRLPDAAACYRRALELDPGIAEAQLNLGHALKEQGEAEAALACYRAALALRPDYDEARWSSAMGCIPVLAEASEKVERTREQFAGELDALARWFEGADPARGARAVGVQQPFWLAYQERDNRPLLESYGRLCAGLMARWQAGQGIAAAGPARKGPIRVAVVSQYFRSHSVWTAIVRGWFGQIDRARVELSAFCVGGEEDEETAYARRQAARFERGPRSLREWADAILAAQPEVILYPELGMDPMSAKLASLRLAPVQAASWGHPETTGLPSIDYYLSAELLEPPGAQAHYSERLVTLPALGCYVERAQARAVAPQPGRWGIDPDAPLLLCPGVPFKYAPEHDAVLAGIARRVPRAKLVFFTYAVGALSEKLGRRLQAAFAREGLEFGAHAVFVPWQPQAAFRGWLERADVYLDTIGFSGFNTALQAVEAGLPVVTREGRFMRGRLASAILKRMGLQEMVAGSQAEYVSLAVRLAQDEKQRAALRARLARERAVLFEDRAPIRELEAFLARAARGPA